MTKFDWYEVFVAACDCYCPPLAHSKYSEEALIRGCLNRFYYASFGYALQVAAKNRPPYPVNNDGSDHKEVRLFIEKKMNKRAVARRLRQLHGSRKLADYSHNLGIVDSRTFDLARDDAEFVFANL